MSERELLEQTIAALEAQRAGLGAAAVEGVLAGLRQRLAGLSGAEKRVDVPDLAGERKLVTVLFADISGFTALSEQLDPEHVRTLVNDCFGVLVPVVERYGGVVDKFIGDEVMALFGAPVAHENDAERALRASLDMREAILEFSQSRGVALGMHFGLECGTVVAGGLGAEGYQQYSVVGDAVNTAARLEDLSGAGEILVGPHVHHLTSALFAYEALPPLRIKGKAGLVPVYRLLSAEGRPARASGFAGVTSPLVGRDEELQALVQAVRGLSSGRGRVLALTGEPGAGKSRLVAEARSALGSEARWGEGRALSYSQGTGYAVVQSMLDDLLGVRPDAHPEERGEALYSSLHRLLPQRSATLYPYLARLYGAPLEAEAEAQIAGVLPATVTKRMHAAFADVVGRLASLQPLVLVWEDMHWVDPSSLALLESLVADIAEVPLLLLLVFRPEEGAMATWYGSLRAPAGDEGRYSIVKLDPLTSEESEQLLENLLRTENVPASTLGLILGKAEGNPFFLEELLRSLLDSGLLVLEGTQIRVDERLADVQIPDTLQGVVAARVDLLPSGEKRALQDASVIGRVFQKPVLACLFQHEAPGDLLGGRLTALERRELIRRREIQFEYIFKHAVTQEVTYNSLLLARRKELHRVAAESIEALFPDQLDSLCETLARHYQRAGVSDRAMHYLVLAAERARRTYSNAEAIGFYRAALEQAEGQAPDVKAEVQESLGDLLSFVGLNDEAQAAFGDALALRPADQRVSRSRLQRKTAGTRMAKREAEETLALLSAAETTLGPEPSRPDAEWKREHIEIQLERCFALYWLNRTEEIAELVRWVVPLVERDGTPLQRVRVYSSVIGMRWRQERYAMSDEILEFARRGVAAASESGDKYQIAWQTITLALSHLFRHEVDSAKTCFESALEVAEHIGAADEQVMCLAYLAVVHRMLREPQTVRLLCEKCAGLALENRMPFYAGHAEANLAWADWSERDAEGAKEHGRRAQELWGTMPNPGVWFAAWPLLSVALHEGDLAEAVTYARLLLAPPAMRMPPNLELTLQEAVAAWEGSERMRVPALLSRSVELAEALLWL